MHNVEVRTLAAQDGSPVCNVAFDLSAVQLGACERAGAAVLLARHRGQEMSTDDVLAMRELTSVVDELARLSEHEAHGTVVLPLARFATLHDALAEWVTALSARDWTRAEEGADLPIVAALLDPMSDVRAQALRATLGTAADRAR